MGNARDRFGPFIFDRKRMVVTKDGEPVPLGGRGAALLGALLDARGQVVEKDALISAAWPNVIVEDGNLTVQITALRKALGQKPDGTDWIVTARNLGYRLVAGEAAGSGEAPDQETARLRDTLRTSAAAVEPSSAVGPTAPSDRLSVAVRPFENLSDDQSQGNFAIGLRADLVAALCRIPELAVVSDDWVSGREVEPEVPVAQYLIQGTVRKEGDTLRVTTQLGTAAGLLIWSRRFDRTTKDFFALQDEIVRNILVAFESNLIFGELARVESRGTTNLEAWLLRVEAEGELWKFTRTSTKRVRELYLDARDLDPQWSLPWGGLAWACWREAKEGWAESKADAIAEGVALAERAIELGPLEPIGYMQLGNLLQLKGEHERAIALRERAVQLAPSDFGALCGLGGVLAAAGLPARALQVLKRAAKVAPRYPPSLCDITAFVYLLAGDNEAALDFARQAIARRYENAGPHVVSAIALTALGRTEEAKQAVLNILQVDPHYTVRTWGALQAHLRDRSVVERLSRLLEASGLPL